MKTPDIRALDRYYERIIGDAGTRAFTIHGAFADELYKSRIVLDARAALRAETWTGALIGSGKILSALIAAIEVKGNNLLTADRRYGEAGRAHQSLYAAMTEPAVCKPYERTLFEFFTSDSAGDPEAFEAIAAFAGRKYPFLAYLYFIKDHHRYAPIAPSRFDIALQAIGVDLRTGHQACWDNYSAFCAILQQIRHFLDGRLQADVGLLNAHSFLWKIVQLPEDVKREGVLPRLVYAELSPMDPWSGRLRDRSHPLVVSREEDERRDQEHRMKGATAERLVLECERSRLGDAGHPDLADRVTFVGDDRMKGFDVLSFDEDGTERQIEVKCVYANQFFISRNEVDASREYPNFHLYLVENADADSATVTVVRRPEIADGNHFTLEPLKYRATYRLKMSDGNG